MLSKTREFFTTPPPVLCSVASRFHYKAKSRGSRNFHYYLCRQLKGGGMEIIMKKKFKLTDLDCANCAAKMEDAIKKLDGVNDASVSFMMQKMTIDADDARFDEIMKEVVEICKKVEPDCIINM